MSDPLPMIKKVAEAGLKHAQGSAFPIDMMEQCLKTIIEIVEDHNGKRPT